MDFLTAFGCCVRQKKPQSKAQDFSRDSTVNDVSDGVKELTILDSKSRDVNDLDFLAPSVHYLETVFLDYVKENGLETDATIYDIEDLQSESPGLIRKKGEEVECPIDGKIGSAFVHTLQGTENVGMATHMLSYAWGYKIQDIVDTLVSVCESNNLDKKKTYIWICCLCNNQHRVVQQGDVSFEEFRNIFNKRVLGIGRIIAMMAPWNNPGYLKRVWCVFEMFEAYSSQKCDVQIAMPPKEKESLLEAIRRPTDSNGRNGLDDLFQTLANTKVENAEAYSQADKKNIIRLVEEGPGCYNLNVEVNHLMRKWVRSTVMDGVEEVVKRLDNEKDLTEADDIQMRGEVAVFCAYVGSYLSGSGEHSESLKMHQRAFEIYDSAPGEDTYKEEKARTHNNLGTEYESLGDYENALDQHNKCRVIFEEIYGTEHENTSTSYFNIGAVKRKLDDLDGALEMYFKSIAIDEKVKGTDHIDTALGYSYVGRVYMAKEDYDGAVKMFEKSLEIREASKGKNHPDVAIGLGDMGLIYHMRKEYDKAIENHKKALEISERVLGNYHPDTGSCYQNLGGAYYEKGDYDNALKLCQKAKDAYLTTFGPDHPKTETAQAWLDIVNEALEELGNSDGQKSSMFQH